LLRFAKPHLHEIFQPRSKKSDFNLSSSFEKPLIFTTATTATMSANPNNQHLRLPPILDQQDGYVRRVPYTPEEMEVIEAGYRWPSINNFAP